MFDPAVTLPGVGSAAIEPLLGRLVAGLAALVIVYALGRLAVEPAVVGVVRARNRRNSTLHEAVRRYARVAVVAVAVAAAVVAAGYGAVLTQSALLVAAVTVAIGVAGQEVIGNVVSGAFLVADRNFNVGDWIVWNGNEGAVESIAFRVTRVRTANNEVVSVPNTELTTTPIARPYSRNRFRVTETVEVARAESMDEACELLVEAAADGDAVLGRPEPSVRVASLGTTSVTLEASFWVADPGRESVAAARSAFVRRVTERFGAAGLSASDPSVHELDGELGVRREE